MSASTALLADPSILGPKLHFGDQLVANNAPGTFANTPSAIPGADDDAWNLIEWSQQEVLNPAGISIDDPQTFDPALGTNAAYSWKTPNGETGFKAYDTAARGWVYDIASAGTTSSAAEQDVFMQTATALSVNMGGNEVDYAMTARIVSEGIDPMQPSESAVFAAAVTGFTLNYNLKGQPDYDPAQASFNIFLQIPLSDTQHDTSVLSYYSETTNPGGQPSSVISDQLRAENALLMPGPAATTETYNLTAYVADLASYLSIEQGLGDGVTDLSRWTLGGVYVGVMTQGAGAYADMQVSNIELTRAAAPSQAARQINPAQTVVVTVAAPVQTATSVQVSDDGSGSLQIALSASARPQMVSAGAGAFNLPGGGQGYFDPTGNGEEVARLYQAAVGLHPDAQTVALYTAPIDAGGMGLLEAANAFLTSTAYEAAHGNASNAGFVASLYQNTLGRTPDAPALSNSLSALANGISQAALLVSVATSPEAVLNNTAWDGSNVWGQDYREFETIVGRAPDSAAQYWMANLAGQGLTPSGVIAALIATNELQSRYAQESASTAVQQIYQTGLGRAPDPNGLANAVALLQSGGSMVTLASTISNSAEARNLYATDTHANWVNTA